EVTTVRQVAVLEELLAVIGRDHDDRVVEDAVRLELLHQLAERLVPAPDVALVELAEMCQHGGPRRRDSTLVDRQRELLHPPRCQVVPAARRRRRAKGRGGGRRCWGGE